MIYEPLKPKWKVDEDSSVPAVDQIKARANSEANYHWSKNNSNATVLPRSEFIKYLEKLGRNYLKNRK